MYGTLNSLEKGWHKNILDGHLIHLLESISLFICIVIMILSPFPHSSPSADFSLVCIIFRFSSEVPLRQMVFVFGKGMWMCVCVFKKEPFIDQKGFICLFLLKMSSPSSPVAWNQRHQESSRKTMKTSHFLWRFSWTGKSMHLSWIVWMKYVIVSHWGFLLKL